MRWLSTVGTSPPASLNEALRSGLAPDGGLYLPERIEPLPTSFFAGLAASRWLDTAARLAEHLLAPDLTAGELRKLVVSALDFPIPLLRLSDRIWVLELFHGPTLAFKDIGARFLARLLEQTQEDHDPLTVLVATSGDTGGAVAQAFFGSARIRVAVLYPNGQVTPMQERQFATLGGNIRAFAVDGTFDDCQQLVKTAFADRELASRLGLTSANSINIGRLVPQIFYYFHAMALIENEIRGRPVVYATPSGNFGNLTAGLLAKRLGLECRFIAATNINDVVPSYLASGHFEPRPSQRTVSNAMDVGNPSNFARIRHLYAGDLERLRSDVRGQRISDAATRETIQRVDQAQGYLLDPHSAVAYRALEEALGQGQGDAVGIVLATAHPAKFREVVEPAVGRPIPLPRRLASRLDASIQRSRLAKDMGELVRQLTEWVDAPVEPR